MNRKELVTMGLAAMLAAACQRELERSPNAKTHATTSAASPAALKAALKAPPLAPSATDLSLYDLDLELLDQSGKRVPLSVFRGHPVLISMFYASCPYACPTLISDIKRVERTLDEPTRQRLRVLLVSFDPARDTPEQLTALAHTHGVDPGRWLFTSVAERKVPELAAVLGIKYKRLPDGGFNHTSVVTLLDATGVVRAHTEAIGRDSQEIVSLLGNHS